MLYRGLPDRFLFYWCTTQFYNLSCNGLCPCLSIRLFTPFPFLLSRLQHHTLCHHQIIAVYSSLSSYFAPPQASKSNTDVVTMEGHKRTVWHVMYSPDNQQLASASGDNTARLWDVETGTLFMELKGHTEPVTFLSYSFQGASLATCSIDTTIRMYASCTSQNSVPPLCRSPKSRERVWRP